LPIVVEEKRKDKVELVYERKKQFNKLMLKAEKVANENPVLNLILSAQ